MVKLDKHKKYHRPVVLLILDGFGLASDGPHNAIAQAKMPNFKEYLENYPALSLRASGVSVGLANDESGDSAVGHQAIGCGRAVFFPEVKIVSSLSDGSFFNNPTLLAASEAAIQNSGAWHLIGSINDQDDATVNYYYALLEFAKLRKIKKVFFHLFVAGNSRQLLERLQKKIDAIGLGKIVTITGISYGLDVSGDWSKTEQLYKTLTTAKSEKKYQDVATFINAAEESGFSWSNLPPTIVAETDFRRNAIKDGDSVIFFDQEILKVSQLLKGFVLPGFERFTRPEYLRNLFVVSLLPPEKDLPAAIAFPEEEISLSLSKIISDSGLKQIKISETSKYVYVTYFFNGCSRLAFPGEEQILISANSASPENYPAMAADKIADLTMEKLDHGNYDFLLVNLANPDEVAHSGNFTATVSALEAVDKALGQIVTKTLAKDGVVIITSDHGNAEEVAEISDKTLRQHTASPVPMLIVGKEFFGKVAADVGDASNLATVTPTGDLTDIAPTILKIFGLKRPEEMSGKPLI